MASFLPFLSEFYLLFFTLSSLIFSIIHSKRYGILITSFNLKLLFSLVSFLLLYFKLSSSLSLLSLLSCLLIFITSLILLSINLPRIDEYTYYLFSLLSSLFLLYSSNLITIYLFVELLSFSLYLLVSVGHDNSSTDLKISSSINYFILGAIFSSFFLLGIYYIYNTTGQTNLDIIMKLGVSHNLGALLIYVALFFKLGVAPFSLLIPSIYYGASSKVSIFLSTIPKLPLIYILYLTSISFNVSFFPSLLSLSILLSLVLGSISALNVTSLKSLLAYSSINSLGFLLIPLLIPSSYSIPLLSFYLFFYLFSSLFLWIYLFSTSTFNLNTFRSSFFNNLPLNYSFLIILFSLAGIPPFLGFFPKFSLFLFSFHHSLYLITFIALFTSLLSAFYYLRLLSFLFFSPLNLRTSLVSLLVSSRLTYFNSYLMGFITYLTLVGALLFM